MKNLIKILVVGTLLAASTAMAAHVSIGLNIGGGYGYYAPPPPPRVVYYASPGPEYVWVNGYYYSVGRGWRWRAGYWSLPPYANAYWVAPRYVGGRYYTGYWGRRGGYGYRVGYYRR